MAGMVPLGQRDTSNRNAVACPHVAASWPKVGEICRLKGYIRQSLDIIQAQGGFEASAGTHREGTCVDSAQINHRIVLVFRQAGWPGTWRRGSCIAARVPAASPADNFADHTHAGCDCPCRSGADYQVTEVERGGDGLVGQWGDYEPKPDVWRDWAQGMAWADAQLAHLRRPIEHVVVDGKFGPQTVRRLQQMLGSAVIDGIFGPATKRLLQGWLGEQQDGNFGHFSTVALQGKVGAVADGNWGPRTTAALQTWLNTHRG